MTVEEAPRSVAKAATVVVQPSRRSQLRKLSQLHLLKMDRITPHGVRFLATSPFRATLFELKLHGIKGEATDVISHQVAKLAALKVLHMTSMNLTEAGIKCLTRSLSSSLQNLHTLTLTRPQSFDNTDITHLSELPRLRRLNINFSSVTDAGLETISRSIPLELLDLRSCRNMSDAGAFHITCMSSSLTALHIHCEHLSAAGLALLSGLVNLQTLGMSCITIPNADQQRIQTVASVLSSMKQLRTLEIQGTDNVDGSFAMVEAVPAQKIQALKLTTCATAGLGVQMLSSLRRLDRSWGFDVDASLRHLAGLANLVELSLANSDLTDRGLATLRELQCQETLLQLNLSHCCDITDAGMKEVSHFGGLVELDISACRRVSDVGLWYLSRRLFHLSKLSFRCCPRVSDNGLRYIASTLHRLTELSIGTSAVISDAGILKLAAMPCLVEVDIGKSPLVTADALTLLPCTQTGNGSHFPRPMPLRRSRQEEEHQ